MDDHSHRMVQRFVDAVASFRAGRISLLDLSSQAESVASTLDNASAPIPAILHRAASDLESAYFTVGEVERLDVAERIIAPVLNTIDRASGREGPLAP